MANSVQLLLARNVRYYRTRLKLTQFQLSEIMDCSPSFIGFIENGKSSVSFDTIEALSRALQITPAQLFTPVDELSPQVVPPVASGYSPHVSRFIFEVTHLIDKYKKRLTIADPSDDDDSGDSVD